MAAGSARRTFKNVMKIPITKPYFGEEERKAVLEPLDTGWVVQGPKVAEFENAFATYTGSRHAVATTSCTTALEVALAALGVGAGDEVIVPAFTWVATANVVELVGATPVFADIDLDTFNVDPAAVERAITPRTKVIMPVSLFGVSSPLGTIVELARHRGITVVEDDACAVGARYRSKHAGTLADIACFSFHPRKAITTGEGGMLITNDAAIAERARSLRDHGASVSDLERHGSARPYLLPEFEMVGYNCRMTDLQGAIGVVQLSRLEWLLEQRRRVAAAYDLAFAAWDWLKPQRVPRECVHGYQAYVCLFRPEPPTVGNLERLNRARNELMDRLQASGVATRPGTHAVHLLGYYARKYGLEPQDFPNAWIADHLTLTVPLYAQMTSAEQEYVVTALSRARD